jgi:recombination protein RecR
VYAPPVQRLITELAKLPGVGGRTAQRLAFHLLRVSDEDAFALADAIREVKQRIGLCEVCFNLADGPVCRICADERRDPELIDPEDLKIAELYSRVEEGIVREVVIATNPTTTGEATALHIAQAIRQRAPDVSVTRLASGLPVGADLEYADELTLGRARSGRRAV